MNVLSLAAAFTAGFMAALALVGFCRAAADREELSTIAQSIRQRPSADAMNMRETVAWFREMGIAVDLERLDS